ncbi:MAG TPA: glycosyltransferase family 4 protein [Devosiaceae bacterium]|nr:glycosyltransferase family 4 protein [Devosiaceae bacterium]
MKVLLHDYGGHAFTGQLATQLAEMGCDIVYVWFAGFPGPKGRVSDPGTAGGKLRRCPLDISAPFDKDNLLRRGLQQFEYARKLKDLVIQERPDVVISANSPLEVQQSLLKSVRGIGGHFVYWLQDIHSDAIASVLGKKSATLGHAAGAYYRAKEKSLIRSSDKVVAIADSFRATLAESPWRLSTDRVSIIENWAPLQDIPSLPRDNDWSVANMRPERLRIVYTGTLARKHNPDVLVELARSLDADVWVFSEGHAPNYVAERAATEGIGNLFVRPWLRAEDLPKALAGADILCAIIEADAGAYSVPSKVLSYLAAGRPILASLPLDNLAARTIMRAAAGLVAAPNDPPAMLANARRLLDDAALRQQMEQSGRRYAESTFDIAAIGQKFIEILNEVSGRSTGGRQELRHRVVEHIG